MIRKVLTFIIGLMIGCAGIMGVEDVREKILEERENFKKKWLPTIRLKRTRERIREIMSQFRRPWKYVVRRYYQAILTPLISSLDAIAVSGSKWAGGIDVDTKCGCWHTEDDGATKTAYAGAVYRETWPSSADGSYNDGDIIHGDMDWGVSKTGSGDSIVVSDGQITLERDNTGTQGGQINNHNINVSQMQTIHFDYKMNTLSGGNGGYIIFYSVDSTGTTRATYCYLQSGTIGLFDGGSIVYSTIGSATWKSMVFKFDFINRKIYFYLDGEYNYTWPLQYGSNELYTNAITGIAFTNRVGSITPFKMEIKNFKVADSLDNIGVHFYDTLNENTLSDYTLGGDTNPTYDSTEKAIKFYDDTDADNSSSYVIKTINSPQDNVSIKLKIKRGINDTSTDTQRFLFRYRSASDNNTFIAFYLDNNTLWFINFVSGTTYGSTSVAWTLSADTWYDINLIIDMNGTLYLFRDNVELLSFTPTKLKRFYDGEILLSARHDASQISEFYVKDILVEDLPTVNAPRSTPPGLLTSGLTPAIEGTFWENYECYWPKDAYTILENNGGIFGHGIKRTFPLTTSSNDIYFYFGSGAKDLSNVRTVRFAVEMSEVKTMYVNAYTGAGSPYVTVSGLTIDKKKFFEFDTSEWTGADWSDFDYFRFRTLSPTAGEHVIISDIQLIGGPEHSIVGQPLYSSPGIDDIDEWTLSGDTLPVWNTDHYELTDATAKDSAYSKMDRSLSFNMNGMGVIRFTYEFQTDDTSTRSNALELYLYIDSSNYYRLIFDRNANTYTQIMLSGGVQNWFNTGSLTFDTNEHDVVIFFHKDYGIRLYHDDLYVGGDDSINGTWDDWLASLSISFSSQHDNGEKSNVHIKDISIERHPLQVHQYQSNELEFLTDSLSPTGSDYMDGSWAGGGSESVASSGNPITNGKYILSTGVPNAGNTIYTFDSSADLRRFTKIRFYTKYSVAGNGTIYLRTSSGNQYTQSLAHSTDWKMFELDLPNVTGHGWSTVGNPDLGSIADILIFNNTGSSADCSFYGFQFLSPEYDKENFIPQTLDIDWDAGSSKYGTFYFGSNEKARLYKVNFDGYVWLDSWDITWLDDLYGYGTYGDPQNIEFNATGETISFMEDVDIGVDCKVYGGTVRVSDDSYHLGVGGVLTVESGGTFGHSAWEPTTDSSIGSIICTGGTIYFPKVSGGGKLIITDETNNYAIKVSLGSTVYHNDGHVQINTGSDTLVDMGKNDLNILEVISGYNVYLIITGWNELRETSGRIIPINSNNFMGILKVATVSPFVVKVRDIINHIVGP